MAERNKIEVFVGTDEPVEVRSYWNYPMEDLREMLAAQDWGMRRVLVPRAPGEYSLTRRMSDKNDMVAIWPKGEQHETG